MNDKAWYISYPPKGGYKKFPKEVTEVNVKSGKVTFSGENSEDMSASLEDFGIDKALGLYLFVKKDVDVQIEQYGWFRVRANTPLYTNGPFALFRMNFDAETNGMFVVFTKDIIFKHV